MAAARTAAPMLATAFDATLAHVGHRGPGAAELATKVLSDRPPAVIDTAWTPVAVPDVVRVADELHGTGLSPGVVEGAVRVVNSAADPGLQSGDIAVVTAADIEAVTLLGTPAAVLTDGESTLIAVTRAASDFGVPVVAGIGEDAARLCTGMRVRVDGATGLVTVLALDCEVVGA